MASKVEDLDVRIVQSVNHQLDNALVHKTSEALLKHIRNSQQKEEAQNGAKNLFELDEASNVETVWLIVSTKKHLVAHKRLKPTKVPIPHSLNPSPTLSICLIVPDPQRAFKKVLQHPNFALPNLPRIDRVVDIKKLEKKYYSFESKRQLKSSYDLFLADDRIITYLPKIMGKTFFSSTVKRPIPVSLQPRKMKEDRRIEHSPTTTSKKRGAESIPILGPLELMQEIQRTLKATMVSLGPSSTIAVRVGLASFTSDQLSENVEAVVKTMVDKVIPNKWRGLKAIHAKGPNSMALPIWLAEEMWEDEAEVLEDVESIKRPSASLNKKRKPGVLEDEQQHSLRNTKSNGGSTDLIKRKKPAVYDPGEDTRAQRKQVRQHRKEVREKLEKQEPKHQPSLALEN